MDIEKKLDEVGAMFEQCPWRSLQTPHTGDHLFRNISSNCHRGAEIGAIWDSSSARITRNVCEIVDSISSICCDVGNFYF
jgi:hypothetical protein